MVSYKVARNLQVSFPQSDLGSCGRLFVILPHAAKVYTSKSALTGFKGILNKDKTYGIRSITSNINSSTYIKVQVISRKLA